MTLLIQPAATEIVTLMFDVHVPPKQGLVYRVPDIKEPLKPCHRTIRNLFFFREFGLLEENHYLCSKNPSPLNSPWTWLIIHAI